MENESSTLTPTSAATIEWTSTKVYSLGAICLVLGMILGALFHGPAQPSGTVAPSVAATQPSPHGPTAVSDPAFEKAKNAPTDFDAQSQAGNAAMKGGDAQMAVEYYGRALKVKDDLNVRTNLANAYFRVGDIDQSLSELAKVLVADPKNDKALYNTGVVRLMGKRDAKGAIESWEAFLKYHPDHPHKVQVQEMIKRAKKLGAKA